MSQGPFQAADDLRISALDCLIEVVFHGHALEQAAYDVEHLVGPEFPADGLQLAEQRLHHPALACVRRDQVDDDDRIVGLAIPMDTAHPLLEPGGVPRDVVVDHQPAKLKVDALPGGICSNEIAGAAVARRPAEELDLPLALAIVHAAVDRRDLSREAEPFEPAHEEVSRVAVLSEDDELLV